MVHRQFTIVSLIGLPSDYNTESNDRQLCQEPIPVFLQGMMRRPKLHFGEGVWAAACRAEAQTFVSVLGAKAS